MLSITMIRRKIQSTCAWFPRHFGMCARSRTRLGKRVCVCVITCTYNGLAAATGAGLCKLQRSLRSSRGRATQGAVAAELGRWLAAWGCEPAAGQRPGPAPAMPGKAQHFQGPQVSCCAKYLLFASNVLFWVGERARRDAARLEGGGRQREEGRSVGRTPAGLQRYFPRGWWWGRRRRPRRGLGLTQGLLPSREAGGAHSPHAGRAGGANPALRPLRFLVAPVRTRGGGVNLPRPGARDF